MRRLPYLTLISAILLVASFAPWDFTFLLPIALVPWLVQLKRIQNQGPKAWIKEGLLLSFFMSIFGFYWVATVLINYSGLHWIWGIVGLFLYSWVGQPQFPLFALAWGLLSKKRPFPPFFWALLYTSLDFFIPKLFADSLGHATYHYPRMRQSADLWGAAGLTFLFAWINFALTEALPILRTFPKKANQQLLRLLAPPLLMLAANWVYGAYRLEDIRSTVSQAPRKFRAALIQANIGDFDKLASEQGVRGAADQVMQTFFQLSDQALRSSPHPDAIIWPETAFPSTFRNPLTTDELRRDQMMDRYAAQNQIPLFFGGYDHSQGRDHNAFFFLQPAGEVSAYRKHILLLFGEYIPGADTFSWIKQAFPQVGQFGRGPGPTRIDVPLARLGQLKIAPIICYEALFPWFLIGSARLGAEIIINITNDSWFGMYGEPDLHLALSTFRSIETRMPQIRSTNTGISGWIDATGEIRDRTNKFVRTVSQVEVPLPPQTPSTLLVLLGDWFPTFALIITLAMLGHAFWKKSGQRLKRRHSVHLWIFAIGMVAPFFGSSSFAQMLPCRTYREGHESKRIQDESPFFVIVESTSTSKKAARLKLGPYTAQQAEAARLISGYSCGNIESGRIYCAQASVHDLSFRLPAPEGKCQVVSRGSETFLQLGTQEILWKSEPQDAERIRLRSALKTLCGEKVLDFFCSNLGELQWKNPFPMRNDEPVESAK